MPADAVFAYGSLAHPGTAAALCGPHARLGRDYFPAALAGYRRAWTVATDNTAAGREVAYFEPGTGIRPPCQVLFLDAGPMPGASLDGALLPVRAEDLPALDEREGNYRRVLVTEHVDMAAIPAQRRPGRVWLYVGTAEAARAATSGTAAGTAVIWRRYLDRVTSAFSFYDGVLDRFREERLPVPPERVVDLDRRRAGRPADPYGGGPEGVTG
ncbi:gamma-glutamylcyclotransferase family protein [Actinoplanes philippinensis]|uniref:gamma-glutamylcyclotransferase family protein n=1 Tax=Actinoplanes philippinensis TaxID=35752 RepID=UPI0033FDBAA9